MPSQQDIDYFFHGEGMHDKLAPMGKLQEFSKLQSFGQYRVEEDVQDRIVALYTEDYYSYGQLVD